MGILIFKSSVDTSSMYNFTSLWNSSPVFWIGLYKLWLVTKSFALDFVLSSFNLQILLPSHPCLRLPSGVFPWSFKPVCCMPCPYILNLITLTTLDACKLKIPYKCLLSHYTRCIMLQVTADLGWFPGSILLAVSEYRQWCTCHELVGLWVPDCGHGQPHNTCR